MIIGVTQSYIFLYIVYFQHVSSIDSFVFYYNVNYIKQGRININKILLDSKENLFTISLKKPSLFQLINETELHSRLYQKWSEKFLSTIKQSYNKSQFFSELFLVIEKALIQHYNTISELTANSIIQLSSYLGLKTQSYYSSNYFVYTKIFERADRLIAIYKTKRISLN